MTPDQRAGRNGRGRDGRGSEGRWDIVRAYLPRPEVRGSKKAWVRAGVRGEACQGGVVGGHAIAEPRRAAYLSCGGGSGGPGGGVAKCRWQVRRVGPRGGSSM